MRFDKEDFDRINNVLFSISETLLIQTFSDFGLLGGKSGIMLFAEQYSFHKQLDYSSIFQNWFDCITTNPESISGYFFAEGKCGINWFYTYLNTSSLITNEYLEMLCHDYELLHNFSLKEIKKGNYDFLYGAVGIAYYFVHNHSPKNVIFFQSFFDELSNILLRYDTFPSYNVRSGKVVENEIDLGLAHGLPSILKVCIECYKKGICRSESKNVAYGIIEYCLSSANIDTSRSYFPFKIEKEKKITMYSRLAWCYGDAGIAFILYQAGVAFNDTKLIDFAIEVLLHTTKRRSTEDTSVNDAGICHGSAGIAHIYNKMWHYTKNSIFKEATNHWIKKTLDFAVYENDQIVYKSYNAVDSSYENNYSLIGGMAGIGLVLLSYITGDFSWDYCIMLND